MVYDERNLEFSEGGSGWETWMKTKEPLKEGKKSMLQKCTWQQIVHEMKKQPELARLVELLNEKYGF